METHFSQSDARFNVRAYTAPNRHGNPQHRVRYWYKGEPPIYQTCSTQAEATRQAGVIWSGHIDGLLDAPAVVVKTLQKLLDAFTARDALSAASIRSYKQACGTLVTFLGDDKELAHIGKAAIEKWQASLSCKPVSKQTYLRNVSALFKWAKKQGHIKVDPTADIRVHLGRADHKLRPWMPSQEWAKFLEHCKPVQHRIRAEFVLHTGLRASEVTAARWDWVITQGDKKLLSVPPGKSARERAIPLDNRALQVLGEAAAKWGSTGYLFSKEQIGPGNFRRDTVKACVAAGVTVTDFHGLRRACGSHWLACGVALFTVSKWLGHADVSTTARHYAGLADSLSQSEMAKVNAMQVA